MKGISSTIGKINTVEIEYSDISEESETEESLFNDVNKCVVCLNYLTAT